MKEINFELEEDNNGDSKEERSQKEAFKRIAVMLPLGNNESRRSNHRPHPVPDKFQKDRKLMTVHPIVYYVER